MKFDTIIIGGGHTGLAKAVELQQSGLKCAVISKGRSIYGSDTAAFEKIGGTVFMGDEVTSVEYGDGVIKSLSTENLREVALEADRFYLATGKFFAGGLVADMDKVYEPVFGIDVRYDSNRDNWFSEKFADPQPFMDFGVITDAEGHALKDGAPIVNLFPIGEIIANN